MRRSILCLAVAVIFPGLSLGNSVAPWAPQCSYLDRIAIVAVAHTRHSAEAFTILKEVAAGRLADLSDEQKALSGETRWGFDKGSFLVPDVRAHAFRKIGEIGSPDAIEFLRGFSADSFDKEHVHLVWPMAQTALFQAMLNQIHDAHARRLFLEETAHTFQDAISNSLVQTWAVEELCDTGTLESLPVIRESITRRDPFERGANDVRFCEARIAVIRGNADRIVALGRLLRTGAEPGDYGGRSMRRWAVSELTEMHSERADGELKRFAVEIGRLPEGDPRRQRLGFYRQDVEGLLERNAALREFENSLRALK